MGRAKEWLMEQQQRGWRSVPGKYVCEDCVNDYALQDHIRANATSNTCSYCGRTNPSAIAAKFDDLAEAIMAGLRSEYGDPNDEGVGWEGGWVGDVIDTYDALFDEIGLDIENEELRGDLIDSLGDNQWCQKDFYRLTPSDALRYGWEWFVDFIKHKARFVFLTVADAPIDEMDDDHIPVSKFLEVLGKVIQQLSLLRTILVNSSVYRLRIHDGSKPLTTASELGSPPADACIYPNRMSPAGISMFYGAFDKATCIAETYNSLGKNHHGTFGLFRTMREMTLVDLTKIPPTPSVFEIDSRSERHNIAFLRSFVRDICAQVAKDGKEHIEYVPTQIVAEYIRHVLKVENKSIDGIVYNSSKNGKEACVLFCDNSACVDTPTERNEGWLLLEKTSNKKFKVESA